MLKEFLPVTDLSEHLKTEKVLEGWYILSNEDISILIESISARIRAIYTHGRFGRLQKLLYDIYNIDQELWGFPPAYWLKKTKYTPPLWHALSEKVIFRRQENRLILEGVRTIGEENGRGVRESRIEGPAIPRIEIWLKARQIHYTITYFSKEFIENYRGRFVEPPEIFSCWYPLYTHYQGEKSKQIRQIPYRGNRFYHVIGKELILTDKKGRLPGLKINSEKGYCILSSEKDIVKGNAYRLRVFIRQPQLNDHITIELIPNPVTIKANPYYPVGQRKIEIYSVLKPEVKINGMSIEAKLFERGKYAIEAKLSSEVRYKITAKNKLGQSESLFYAIGNPLPRIITQVCQLQRLFGVLKNQFQSLQQAGGSKLIFQS